MSAITAKASRKMKKYAVLTREPRCFLGSFDFSWEQRKLGECFKERVESMPNGELISVTINDGIKKFSELGRHDNSNDDKSKYKKVCVGDIAYNSMRMWQGASGYSPYEGIVSPAYTVLSPNSGVNSKCLAYQFKLPEMIHTFQINSQGITSDNWNLKYPALSEIEIFVSTDEEEQAKIAEYFENLDHLITLHQRKCANLCSPSQVVFSLLFATSTFSWEQRKLGEMGQTYTGLSGKTKDDFGHGQARFVTYMNVFSNPISNPEMTEPIEIDPKQNEVEVGDVFFTTSSETPEEVGMSSILLEKRGKTYLNSFCFGFRPSEKIDSYYLAYMLRSESTRAKIILLAQGISRYNISKNKVMEIAVSLPSLDEQKMIGQYFSQLDNLITLHQRECISFTGRADRLILTANKKRTTSSWEQRNFADVVQIERGGSPRPIDDYITDSQNGLNWVKIGDAPAQGHYITKTAEKIRPEGLSKTREVHPGDLILSNSMSFGKPYIMGIDGCIHDGWLLIRDTNSTFDLTFLCHLLGTPQMLDQYRSLAAGSTVNNLNKELVGNTVVTIPTIDEQRVLGQYLERLDNLITLHQRKPFLMKWRTSDANRNQTNRLVL